MKKTSEVYRNIYHYTNLQGLLGILDSHVLWATHYKFLNDSSEIDLFIKNRFPDILYPKLLIKYQEMLVRNPATRKKFQESGEVLEDVVKHDVSVQISAMLSGLYGQIYITSFCGESDDDYINQNGLLSQWRGYGQDGGFSIVFDTASMEACMRQEHNMFSYGYSSIADVIYSHDQQKFENELSDSIDQILSFLNTMLDNFELSEPRSIDGYDSYTSFLSCATRYKHRGFSEENEVRFVQHLCAKDYLKSEAREKEGLLS